jgi:hypothetical protein
MSSKDNAEICSNTVIIKCSMEKMWSMFVSVLHLKVLHTIIIKFPEEHSVSKPIIFWIQNKLHSFPMIYDCTQTSAIFIQSRMWSILLVKLFNFFTWKESLQLSSSKQQYLKSELFWIEQTQPPPSCILWTLMQHHLPHCITKHH